MCHPEALRLVVEAAKPGVSVLSLCEKGDAYIMAETGKVFKKEKEMKKGETHTLPLCCWMCLGAPIKKIRCSEMNCW